MLSYANELRRMVCSCNLVRAGLFIKYMRILYACGCFREELSQRGGRYPRAAIKGGGIKNSGVFLPSVDRMYVDVVSPKVSRQVADSLHRKGSLLFI